ncbi:MAG: PEP-CTERM sorting domain-containing protein [Verrucomicrobiaceae bacterium]
MEDTPFNLKEILTMIKKTTLTTLTGVVAMTSLATGATLIDSSGIAVISDAAPDNNSANFAVTNVLDGETTEGWRNATNYDPNNPAGAFPGTGVNRPAQHQNNHYITEDGTQTAILTFDLGGTYDLERIDLLNTSNTAWNDRETATFSISSSTDGTNFASLVALTALQNYTDGFQAVSAVASGVTHVQITINNDSGTGTEPGELSPGTLASANDTAVGLNEVRFYQTVPEPSSALLGGVALLGLLRRKRA